jgi:hypothetical protein
MDTNNDIDDDRTVDMIEELDEDDTDDQDLDDLERVPHRGRRRLLPIERLR